MTIEEHIDDYEDVLINILERLEPSQKFKTIKVESIIKSAPSFLLRNVRLEIDYRIYSRGLYLGVGKCKVIIGRDGNFKKLESVKEYNVPYRTEDR